MITADEIAKLARDLVTPMANEARIRSGVSRAYYAAFHYCSAAAELWCNALPDAEKDGRGSHLQLYKRLEDHCKDGKIESDLKKMAAEAKKLRELRNNADYDLEETIDQKVFVRSLHHMSNVKGYLTSIQTTGTNVTKT